MTQADLLDKQHNVKEIKQKMKWVNTIGIGMVHVLALYALFAVAPLVRWQTLLWGEYFLFRYLQLPIIYRGTR
jgi:hypothetical protein